MKSPVQINITSASLRIDRSPNIPNQDQDETGGGARNSEQVNRERLRTAQGRWQQIFPKEARNLKVERKVHLTAENLKHNHHHGDEMKQKQTGQHRIYIQNANGFHLDEEGGKFEAACVEMELMQADIGCFMEHNLDSTKPQVRKILHDTLRKYHDHSRLEMGSTTVRTEGNYKPGGTMIVATGNLSGRVTSSGSDWMGRWSHVKLRGKNDRVVTIVAAYQVCAKSIEQSRKDKSTAFSQQHSLLRQKGHHQPSPRTHFRKDLLNTLSAFKSDGDEIILVGDFNEVLGSDSSGMSKICRELGLVDIMQLCVMEVTA
jgi:hypothetical protein